MATQKKYVSLEKLGLYDEKIKGVITAGDTKTLTDAKSYADGLAVNYDAAGSAATAEANAKAYADGKDTAIQAAHKAGTDAATAASVADGKAVAAQNAADAAQADVNALATLVGTLPEGTTAKDVVDYVNVKTAGIATDAALEELQGQLSGVQGEVATIKGDYLKASDKSELQGKIDTLTQTHSTDKAALEASIKTITDDYLKAADKTELQNGIDAVDTLVDTLIGEDTGKSARTIANEELAKQLIAEGAQESLDTLAEIASWIQSHPDDASAMNKAIEDLETLVGAIPEGITATTIVGYIQEAVAAEKTRAEGVESGFNTRIGTLETAVGTGSVDQRIADAVAVETNRAQGIEGGLDSRLQAVESKLGTGEGSVDSKIATAKNEAIATAAEDATTKANKALEDAKKYADEEDAKIETRVASLETASATYALKSEVEAVTGRVTTAEGEIDTLQNEMDAVEILAAAADAAAKANQSAIALKASQADLNTAVARIAANESAIANFVEVSEQEINDLFA